MNPEIIAALSAFGGAMNTTTSTNENAYVLLDKKGVHMATIYPKPNAIKVLELFASKIGGTFVKKDPNFEAEAEEFDIGTFK